MNDALQNSPFDYVMAVYGFSFIFLALICGLLRERRYLGIPYMAFSLFAISSGVQYFLSCLGGMIGFSDYLLILSFVFEFLSAVFIFEFGRRSIESADGIKVGQIIYAPLLLVYTAGWMDGLQGQRTALLYAFLLPGAAASAASFWKLRARAESGLARKMLELSAISILLFGVFSLFKVEASSYFPSSLVNSAHFDAVFGFAPQVICGACALILTAAMTTCYFISSVEKLDQLKESKKSSSLNPASWFAVIFIILLGFIATDISERRTRESARREISELGMLVAESIPRGELLSLRASLSDLGSPDYKKLKERLERIKAISANHVSIYLVKIGDDEQVRILLDSEEPGSPDCAKPGTEWQNAPDTVRDSFKYRKCTIIGPFSDRFRTWISSFTPIVSDENWESIAVLGMDIDAGRFKNTLFMSRLIPILITILFLTISGAMILFKFKSLISHLMLTVSERALWRSRERFENISGLSREMIWEISPDGKYTYVSKGAKDMLGYSPDEMTGKMHYYDLFPEHGREKYKDETMSLIARRLPFSNYVNKAIAKDGHELCFLTNGMPSYDEDGVFKGYIGTDMDVTELMKKEQMLLQAQKMEAVGLLAGGVAHDFNNHLTVMKGYAQMGVKDAPKNSNFAKYFDKIRKAADSSANLTRQILLFSRNQPATFKPTDLSSALSEMRKILRRLLSENIKLDIKCPENECLVMGDLSHIEQMLVNLAVNAGEAMQKGGSLEILLDRLSLHDPILVDGRKFHPGNYLKISVCDNGSGMEEEIVNRIFEPFFTTKEFGKGSGLGLAVVYGIVRQHNGWIKAFSSPGKGSRFEICIPEHNKSGGTGSVSRGTTAVLSARPKILFVEDEHSVRCMAKEFFEKESIEAHCVASGEDARKLFTAEPKSFSILIVDIVLSDCDGIELAEEFLGPNPDLRIVVSSGYAEGRSRSLCIQDFPHIFIAKPYGMDELRRAIKKAVAGEMDAK